MKTFFRSFSSSHHLKQILKFAIVGCSNFAISFTIFYLCYEHWHVATLLLNGMRNWGETIPDFVSKIGGKSPEGSFANIIAYTCGLMNSFLWNRIWTFRILSKTTKRLKRFIILNVFCLVLSTIIIFIVVDIMSWPYKMVWFITMAFVTILNFFGSKFWVFNAESIQQLYRINRPFFFKRLQD